MKFFFIILLMAVIYGPSVEAYDRPPLNGAYRPLFDLLLEASYDNTVVGPLADLVRIGQIGDLRVAKYGPGAYPPGYPDIGVANRQPIPQRSPSPLAVRPPVPINFGYPAENYGSVVQNAPQLYYNPQLYNEYNPKSRYVVPGLYRLKSGQSTEPAAYYGLVNGGRGL